MNVWVLRGKDKGPVFVYDNEAAARADCGPDEQVVETPVDHEAVTR